MREQKGMTKMSIFRKIFHFGIVGLVLIIVLALLVGTASAETSETINIPLSAGWNMISCPILPINTQTENVISSLNGPVYLYWYDASEPDILQRWKMWDNTLPPQFWDIENTLKRVDPNKAYWLRVSSKQTLSIEGTKLPDNVVPLYTGWNFVSFQFYNDEVENAMRQLTGFTYLYSYDASEPNELKRWKIWDNTLPPQFWDIENTLKRVEPTKGYWLWVSVPQTWEEGSNNIGSSTPSIPESLYPSIPRTFRSQDGLSKLDGQPVPVGTIITAYDPNGVLCGSYTVTDTGQFVISCIGDDPGTPEDEGAVPGDTITFSMNGLLATVTSGSAEWQPGFQEINIEATSINQPPLANDQSVTTYEDIVKSIFLIATDANEDPLTYTVVGNPSHGTLFGTAPNLFYIPEHNYNGPDSFTFKANDGKVDSNIATVSIIIDGCPNDPLKTVPGVCGCGIADIDSDGDGTMDCIDQCPNDPDKIEAGVCGCGVADIDSDNDSTPDCNDLCPSDPNKIEPRICGCGAADTDSDNDGTMDCIDGCPNDPNKTVPGICGCEIADTDSDHDGTMDCQDLCPTDPDKIALGQCGCGAADTDTDGDTVADCQDSCPNDPNKNAPGICGCGAADTDSDHDGTMDCTDKCPGDPAKIEPGICGCGVADTDSNGDGIIDCAVNVKTRIVPRVINLGTPGVFLAFTRFPDAYYVADIDKGTVTCNGAPATRILQSRRFPHVCAIIFKKSELKGVAPNEKVTLTVKGWLKVKGVPIPFGGSDTVRLISRKGWLQEDLSDVTNVKDEDIFRQYYQEGS
jgi:hypothetical protein